MSCLRVTYLDQNSEKGRDRGCETGIQYDGNADGNRGSTKKRIYLQTRTGCGTGYLISGN